MNVLTWLLHLWYSPSNFDTSVSAAWMVSFSLSSLIFSSAASLVSVSNLCLNDATFWSTSSRARLNFSIRASALCRFLSNTVIHKWQSVFSVSLIRPSIPLIVIFLHFSNMLSSPSILNPCHAEYIKMPRPLLIASQSDYLIQVFDRNSHI